MPTSTASTALIIIDMQKGMQGSTLPPRNNPQAEDNIARLLEHWRRQHEPVVCVRHISRAPASVFAPGQGGVEFQDRFMPQPGEHVVEKNVPDAFINTGLERWLHARGIRNIVIAGVSTNNSVEATARTAGNLGFATVVAADACFAFDKADFAGTPRSAEDVHRMALANLHGEYATVRSTDALLPTPSRPPSPASESIAIHRLGAEQAAARIEELAEVLVDCVEGGASVSFMLPMTRDKARAFWRTVADAVARGERALFAAIGEDGRIAGTVQLITDLPENQPHRADVAKLLVHRRARGAGVGRQLMLALEDAARAQGLTLLVLDTASASAERLYEALGWRRAGVVPDYACLPGGEPCATTFFYKQL